MADETPPTQRNSSSASVRHLRDGFGLLQFADPILEQSFTSHHLQGARTRVQIHLLLSIALVMGLVCIDDYVLHRIHGLQLLLVRFLAIGSLLAGVALTAKKRWYERYYAQAIRVLVPVFGACAVANALIDQPGVSFFAAIVLVVFAIYLLVGLLFVAALCSGMSILAMYLLGAGAMGLPHNELIYNGSILLFTNVLCATASYNFERLIRASFLEAHLLNDMANRDGLTSIYNRRAFDEHAGRLWQQALREHRNVALLLIDIDHFKAYNDYYGHQVGDQCLQQVARTLSVACRRPMDFAARYGGEEFAVVLYDAHRDYATEAANRIQTELRQLAIDHPASAARQLTVSIGAACVMPETGRTVYECLQLADEALYAAKEAGRDRVVVKDTEYAALTLGVFRQGEPRSQRQVS